MDLAGRRILIVEDDLTIAANLVDYLARLGVVPDVAYDGHAALARLRADVFDAVVLDLGLPGLGGLDVLRAMARDAALGLPVLVLTARDGLHDKLQAFELGAQDYLVKPFSLAEVAARLRVLLQRGPLAMRAASLSSGSLRYDPNTYAVTLAGQALALPRKSVLVLAALLQHGDVPVSHARLTALLWPDGPPSDRALHDQLHLLRRRLRAAGGPDVQAVPGHGWRLAWRAQAPASQNAPGPHGDVNPPADGDSV